MLPLSVGLSAAATAAVGFSTSRLELTAAWFAAGICIAGIFPCCVQSIVRWFPAEQRAFPSGALGSAMSLGGAVSTALTGWLLEYGSALGVTSWRYIFGWYGLPGLVWAATFPWWFQERQTSAEISPEATPAEVAESAIHSDAWWTDPRTVAVCAQQFLRAAGYIFYATWFPTYLRETRGVSLAAAGLLTSAPLLAVVLGGAVGGWCIDQIERVTRSRRISRQAVGIVSHALCGGCVLAAYAVESAVLAVALIAAGSLVFALGSASAYAITMDLGGKHVATLFATMNMCGNIGAAICPVVIAALVPRIGWHGVLPVFGGIYWAVACCWLSLDPAPRRRNRG
jgi:MFS family permease